MGDRGYLEITVATGGLTAIGVACLFMGSSHPLWAIALAAFVVAVGQLIRVPAPSGQDHYVGVAAAAAVPLLMPEPVAVGASFSFGLLAAWLVRVARREDEFDSRRFLLPEAAALGAYGSVFLLVIWMFEVAGVAGDAAKLVALVAGALAWFVVGAASRALLEYERRRLALRYMWLLSLGDWPVMLALFATGGLFAFAYPVMGPWAFPVAFMPYGFSHMSFVRYHGTRLTYGQTIRALAAIPEVAGLAHEGHAARTADVAVAMAQDLGMVPSDVTDLEYAALMHDIGRITLNEPAILKAGYTDEDIARWGSQIVAEAPYLQQVAGYVRQQHEPYRRPGEEQDESLPMTSKVIRVASAYDQAVSETGLPAIEALEVLHRGAAYDFDPQVVRSLRRVMTRRGEIVY